MDYHALARQHVITSSADLGGVALAPPRHKPLVIRAVASIFQVRADASVSWWCLYSSLALVIRAVASIFHVGFACVFTPI